MFRVSAVLESCIVRYGTIQEKTYAPPMQESRCSAPAQGVPTGTSSARREDSPLPAELFGPNLRHPVSDPPRRSHRLGDLMGTEFFQPYSGDEWVPWPDDCRDSTRFRVLRPTAEYYRSGPPLEWLRIPKFHLVE
jgi:hypothetical protein